MLGGTSLIKLENDLSVAINHVNSFEVQSSSLDTATYYNPATNLQLEYAKKINNLNYKLNLDFGRSTRGWSLSKLSLGEEDQRALLSCVAKQPGTEVP